LLLLMSTRPARLPLYCQQSQVAAPSLQISPAEPHVYVEHWVELPVNAAHASSAVAAL